MNTAEENGPLRPLLIFGLASLTLVFPLFSLLVNALDGSAVSLGMSSEWIWLLVAVAWILIVWLRRTPHPLATLVLAGLAGGILTVIAIAIIQLSFSDTIDIATSPVGILVLIALSTIGGLVCGLIAWGLQSITRTSHQ